MTRLILIPALTLIASGSLSFSQEKRPSDPTKKLIERPVKVLSRRTVQSEIELATVPKEPKPKDTTNPPVKSGDVNWHTDFDTACVDARTSGKPVFLFHLLGNLDERFT